MDDETVRSNGSAEWPKPAIPNWIVIVSVAVAVLAVSALIWVLFQKTTGPGEIVHRYYQAAAGGDCDTAYSVLSPDLQQTIGHDAFCSGTLDGSLPADPKIESVTLTGPEGTAKTAAVTVAGASGAPALVWDLARQGDTWVITRVPQSGTTSP